MTMVDEGIGREGQVRGPEIIHLVPFKVEWDTYRRGDGNDGRAVKFGDCNNGVPRFPEYGI